MGGGEEVHVELKASKNTAYYNAVYSTVSLCTFKNIVDESKAKIASSKYENESDFNMVHKHKYYHTNEYNEPNKFIFSIESSCGLEPKEIVSIAFEILVAKVFRLIEKMETSAFIHQKTENTDNESTLHEINVNDETHTIGHLVQSLLYNKYVRDKKTLSYIGYTSVHPLEKTIIWKLAFVDSQADWYDFFVNALKELHTDILKIQGEWNKLILK
jgi:DNA-directed RNA polymerase subunit L